MDWNQWGNEPQQKNCLKRLNGNGVTRNPAELPNLLNDFFSTVGQKLAANIPDSNCHYSEYLINTNLISSFFFEPVISLDIELEISLLRSKKAYGLYSRPIRVLKCTKNVLSSPLAGLINFSVQTGKYPSKLKHAKIIPVYKGEDETDPSNYRSISLLSVFNRIFEKIMHNRLKSYIEDNELLYKAQYGFRASFFTQHKQIWTRKCLPVAFFSTLRRRLIRSITIFYLINCTIMELEVLYSSGLRRTWPIELKQRTLTMTTCTFHRRRTR